jgi:hypothetical protein
MPASSQPMRKRTVSTSTRAISLLFARDPRVVVPPLVQTVECAVRVEAPRLDRESVEDIPQQVFRRRAVPGLEFVDPLSCRVHHAGPLASWPR